MAHWSTRIRRLACHSSVTALALAAALSGCATEPESPAVAPLEERFDWERLSPGVADFIKDNYLAHRAEFPDEDEPVGALRAFVSGQELLVKGEVGQAVAHFEQAVAAYLRSRHVHAGLGRALLQSGADKATLERAAGALLEAHRLGLRHGRVRYTDDLSRALGELKDTERLGQVFPPLLARAGESWVLSLDYAHGLARAGSAEAEQWYQRSVQARTDGVLEPQVQYARWLLERNRAAEALAVLTPRAGEADASVLRFYRGYAAEQFGDLARAREEYLGAQGFSEMFALPGTWRTSLASSLGLRFDDDVSAQTHCTGHIRLSQLLYCEARGEGTGGQRVVGWTVRTRVFRGTEQTGCTINNAGATTCDKYVSVTTQSGQFYLCGVSDATSDSVAYDVYFGTVPDPYTRWCVGGALNGTNFCLDRCSAANSIGANVDGPSFFYSTSSICTTRHPSGCGSVPAKTCSNGGSDHCFYRVP
jgi:tetratricopeptide (TPR) repeat protein